MPSRDQLMQALRNADAAGDQQAAQRIAGMIKALPADTPAPAAPPANAGPTKEQLMAQNDPLNDMNWAQKMLVGAGQGFNEMGQGGKQLYAMLTGNKQMAQGVADERNANRQADENLSRTIPGRIGNIGANALVAAVPVGGMDVAATRLGSGVLAKVLGNAAVQGVTTGALQGALQPTDEGQSHLDNAKLGGALGLAAPVAGKLIGGAANVVTGGKGKMLAKVMNMFKNNPDAEAALAQAQKRAVGQKMGDIMSADHQIPITQDAADQVARIRSSYANSLDQDTKNAMDQYILAGNNNGSAPANLVAEARSGAVMNAKAADGAVSNGYYGFQRALDKSTDDYFSSLPKTADEFWSGQSTTAKLKALRSAYGTAADGTPLSADNASYLTKYSKDSPALKARLLKQLEMMGALGAESQATNPKPLNIDITGGTPYPASQPPPQ